MKGFGSVLCIEMAPIAGGGNSGDGSQTAASAVPMPRTG